MLKNISNVERRIETAESLINSCPGEVTHWGKWHRFPPRSEPVKLAIDEWGIWLPEGSGPYKLINRYTWEHALGVGIFFNIFHKHASSIGLAAWAQLVNILAPILTDENSDPRLAQLLPNGKYSRQTKGTGRMAQKPFAILHLASLEETRTEKEKPDSIGRRSGTCLSVEQNPNRDGQQPKVRYWLPPLPWNGYGKGDMRLC